IDHAHGVVDFGDLGAAFAFAEQRVLRVALSVLHGTPLVGERGFGGEMPAARRLHLVAERRDFSGNALGGLTAIVQRLLTARRLLPELGKLGAHLLAALAVTLLRLRELELVDLSVVLLLLPSGDDAACMLESLAALRA